MKKIDSMFPNLRSARPGDQVDANSRVLLLNRARDEL